MITTNCFESESLRLTYAYMSILFIYRVIEKLCTQVGYFFKRFFALCLHEPKSSSLLLRLAPPGVKIMWQASVMQSLHTLVVWLNWGALVTISQLMSCLMFLLLRLHTWNESFDFVLFPILMSDWCWLYRVLNLSPVRPV